MKSTVVSLVGVLTLVGIGVGGALALRAGASAGLHNAVAANGGKTATAPMAATCSSGGSGGGPVADGLIYACEYRHRLYEPSTGMSLFWQNDDTTLYIGLISPGTGWAAVGFTKGDGMEGANLLIGYVKNGLVTIEDHYGVSDTESRKDRESSILTAGGSELDGETTLEFSIPLASHDPQDVDLYPGETIGVILEFQATKDSLAAKATRSATTWIPLD